MNDNLAAKIAKRTGVTPEVVASIVTDALSELHRLCVVGDKGPTDAAMEACFSFGGDAAFHFIGILAADRFYDGDIDTARSWEEVAMRFVPQAYSDCAPTVLEWSDQRTPAQLAHDEAK